MKISPLVKAMFLAMVLVSLAVAEQSQESQDQQDCKAAQEFSDTQDCDDQEDFSEQVDYQDVDDEVEDEN